MPPRSATWGATACTMWSWVVPKPLWAAFLLGGGKPERVRVVCMDLAAPYRALVRCYLPQAQIVADRFHVIRLINQHFLEQFN